jgi:hypothetical protein
VDCSAKESGDRPSFEKIMEWLENLKLKVMPNVNSQKLLENGFGTPSLFEGNFLTGVHVNRVVDSLFSLKSDTSP